MCRGRQNKSGEGIKNEFGGGNKDQNIGRQVKENRNTSICLHVKERKKKRGK
jgi:hypothetical protein